MKLKRWLVGGVSVGLFLLLALCAAVILVPLPEDKLAAAPQAKRFYDRRGELLHVIISEDHYFRLASERSELPDLFVATLLLQEDRHFYQHPGVNPFAILRALKSNMMNGRVVSGASTITMQLARMLDRQPRTLSSKVVELFRSLQLERRFSKDEILTYYLSIAPYGGNLEGLNAATYAYFGKSAARLSPAEMALLVVLPKSPNRTRPDRFPLYAKQKRDELLHLMQREGLIDEDTLRRAIDEPVPARRLRFPQQIPHLAWQLAQAHPEQNDFYTSIDRNIQRRSQRIVGQYIDGLRDQGINNASVVVMDTKSREVRALIGSVDYFDQQAEGANNGATALRSPGSTLKPFLYGLAMDAGLIAEKTLLPDIPFSIAGYSPQNYSQSFRGQVSVREALIDSLNVVAVRLSLELGPSKLYDLLIKGGISSLDKPATYYGLPLVLGGVEVSLLELTTLYAAMANYGEYLPYQLSTDYERSIAPVRLLSEEASWLVADLMTDVERPDFPSVWQYSASRPTVAWKTGTSYGHQDAWSVGYHPEYTVGVWVGNFNGAPASQLSGSSAAAPLFFDVMQAVVKQPTSWFPKPLGIHERSVCDLCGLPGNQFCENTTREQFIPAVKGPATESTCQVRQLVVYNGKERLVDVWPSELAAFYYRHGLPVTDVPPYDVRHMAGQRYYPPVIQSPVEGSVYIKRPDTLADGDQQIKLQAAVTNRIKSLSWYINGKLYKRSEQPYSPLFISLSPGTYEVSVVDDTGGKDSVSLVIKDIRALVDKP